MTEVCVAHLVDLVLDTSVTDLIVCPFLIVFSFFLMVLVKYD